MVRTEKSIGVKKMFVVINSAMLLLTVVSTGPLGVGQADATEKNCLFTKLLENPSFRTRYQQSLARARVFDQETPNDSQAMYGTIVKASIVKEDGKHVGSLDSFSAGCITCHDGIVSRKDLLNFRNDPETRMQMISGKHPIGMNYERYASRRDTLKKTDDLNSKLVLVGGKVSCVTCHDPLNPEKNHLALNDNGRDLCMECHLM